MKSNSSALSNDETSRDDYNSIDNEDVYYEEDYSFDHTSENAYNNGQQSQSNISIKRRFSNKCKVGETTRIIRKRKCRTTFTKNQLIILEQEFLKYNFISNDKVDLLVNMTGLDSRIIKVYFLII